MEIPERHWHGFFISLYQFLMPVVDVLPDGRRLRMEDPSLIQNLDLSILADTDSPAPAVTSRAASSAADMSPRTKSFYKDIGPVQRSQGNHQTNPARPPPPPRPRKSRKEIPKPSSSRAKRTLKDVTDSGLPENNAVKKRKRSDKSQQWDKLKKNSELLHVFLGVDISVASCANL